MALIGHITDVQFDFGAGALNAAPLPEAVEFSEAAVPHEAQAIAHAFGTRGCAVVRTHCSPDGRPADCIAMLRASA